MARPKRSAFQRERDLVFIEERYLQGHPVRVIADMLSKERTYSINHVTIHRDIGTILDRWRERVIDDVGRAKGVELARLAHVEREAWGEWERSKQAFTRESRCGDPRYLQIVQGCVKQRCAILGLDAPEHSAAMTLFDAIRAVSMPE